MGKSKAEQWFLESSVVPKAQRVFVRRHMAELQKRYEFWDYLNLVFKKYQKSRCYYCGVEIHGRPTQCFEDRVERDWEIDHKVAVYYGGTNAPSNLCLACKPCNRKKGADLLERSYITSAHKGVKKKRNMGKVYF